MRVDAHYDGSLEYQLYNIWLRNKKVYYKLKHHSLIKNNLYYVFLIIFKYWYCVLTYVLALQRALKLFEIKHEMLRQFTRCCAMF